MFAYTLAAKHAALKAEPVLLSQHASTLEIAYFGAFLSVGFWMKDMPLGL